MPILNHFTPSRGGGSMPQTTTADNGKIAMVVDGGWQLVKFPAGEQHDYYTLTVSASSWSGNETDGWEARQGDVVHDLTNCYVDVAIAASSTKAQIEEIERCGVYCSGTDMSNVIFSAIYDVPTCDLKFSIRITKPTTLSYSIDEDSMTLTIVEEEPSNEETLQSE